MNTFKILTIILTLFFSSCSFQFPTGPKFSDEINSESKRILEVLLEKDLEKLKPLLVPDFLEIDDLEGKMTQIFDLLPDKDSTEIYKYFTEERRSDSSADPVYPIYRTAFEISDGDDWQLVQIFVRKIDGQVLMQHFKFNQFEERPSTFNNFNLEKKGVKHILFLFVMIAVVLFILFSLYKLVRDKHITWRTKWLWFIFIMLGYWGATMNWTTGDISNNFIQVKQIGDTQGLNFQIIDFNLLGAGYKRLGLLQPWFMEVGIPLGAMVYWFLRWRRVNVEPVEPRL